MKFKYDSVELLQVLSSRVTSSAGTIRIASNANRSSVDAKLVIKVIG